jgi:tight adherence protein C
MSDTSLQQLSDLSMLLMLLAGLGFMWMRKHGGTRGRIAERLRRALSAGTDARQPGEHEAEPLKRLLRRLSAFGDNLPLFDARYRLKLQQEMVRAGYRNPKAAAVLLAVKFIVGMLCTVLVATFGTHLPLGKYVLFRAVFMLGGFMVGMLIPEYVVKFRSHRRREAMNASLPDALDLLVICTNAGNSLAVSIRRVADELADICAPLSDEFSLTADELQLSGDSTRALQGLADRIDLPSIRALISTLIQAMRYGTPITHALRTLSRAERLTHLVTLEEKAAKLAPKMVVPMMIFILPAVVVIAAGPSVIQLIALMASQ